MNSFFSTLIVVGALLPSLAWSEVRLNPGPCVSVRALDGAAIDSAGPLTLTNGRHQLVVDCTVEVGRSSDEGMPETSDAFVLLFEAENVELTLQAPEIRSSRELETFSRRGNWQLTTADQQSVEFDVDVLEKEGFQLVRDYGQELEAFNRSESPAALGANLPGADMELLGKEEGRPSTSAGAPDQEMVNQMLRYWYLKADKTTRDEWKNWIHSSN
ncbi:DUF2057 domain-containing protein [Marinobacter sp. DUT-1]|uniref:DUF2057 domain-containing protein n=1 Tax=Marinobacter sp. DUT-1 TaxID=3412037 RepID=UPI003D177C3B